MIQPNCWMRTSANISARATRSIRRCHPGIYRLPLGPDSFTLESDSESLPAARIRKRATFIQAAISVFERWRPGERLRCADLTHLAISFGFISGERNYITKVMLSHLHEAVQEAQRTPRRGKT